MPYGLDDRGRPIFLISTMAMHTQNLQADPRASLLVTQADAAGDPLGSSRVTLVGNVLPLQPAEVPPARSLYLQRTKQQVLGRFRRFFFLPHGGG